MPRGSRWGLKDRRALGPARGDEIERGDASHAGDEEHQDIGKREAAALDRRRRQFEKDAHECVLAPTIGNGAADKGQDRQRKPRDLIRPKKRLMKENTRCHIGQHDTEFAQERSDKKRFRTSVDEAQRALEAGPQRLGWCRRDIRFGAHARTGAAIGLARAALRSACM